jgi:hypothetical protein
MQLSISIFLALCIVLLFEPVEPIKCIVGYGQTGLRYSNEITWTRNCPNTNYCWKAVTSDIKKMQNLIQYPWVSHFLFKSYFIYSPDSFSHQGPILLSILYSLMWRRLWHEDEIPPV